MFEMTSRAAEKMAVGVSRRAFFGSLGRWAGATALALAGAARAFGGEARAQKAGSPSGGCYPGSHWCGKKCGCLSSKLPCPSYCH